MSRAQEIVEQIRRCLRHYDGKAAAQGQQIARDYAEVVDQVNKRPGSDISNKRREDRLLVLGKCSPVIQKV